MLGFSPPLPWPTRPLSLSALVAAPRNARQRRTFRIHASSSITGAARRAMSAAFAAPVHPRLRGFGEDRPALPIDLLMGALDRVALSQCKGPLAVLAGALDLGRPRPSPPTGRASH